MYSVGCSTTAHFVHGVRAHTKMNALCVFAIALCGSDVATVAVASMDQQICNQWSDA